MAPTQEAAPAQAAAPAQDATQSQAAAPAQAAPTQVATDTAANTANASNAVENPQVASTDSSAAAPAEEPKKKMRNKITYAEYNARIQANAKKKSRTLHHGITVVDADYHDKRYGNMDHESTWGTGIGLYYFYRRYFGHFVGFQGRLGGIYRYSRWTFDNDETSGKLDDGTAYELTHEVDRKYYNFSADLPLSLKLGHHIKKTTGFIYASLTFDLTKPIYEMVDTENRLFLKSGSHSLNEDMKTLSAQGENPFPLYESHQTNKFFYMDDWETSGWIGVGVESRMISVEFQVYGIGGASKNDSHRYYHLGHDSDFTWRLFVDFSLK